LVAEVAVVLHLGIVLERYNVAQVDLPFAYISCFAGPTRCRRLNESLLKNLLLKPAVKAPAVRVETVAGLQQENPLACHQNSHSFQVLGLYLVRCLAAHSENKVTASEALSDNH
jgi:hypothetical protein